jgi:hypothetical protein
MKPSISIKLRCNSPVIEPVSKEISFLGSSRCGFVVNDMALSPLVNNPLIQQSDVFNLVGNGGNKAQLGFD